MNRADIEAVAVVLCVFDVVLASDALAEGMQ